MPLAWKEGTGIFLPKPGKESYFEAKSFRIITLTSFQLKWLERLILYHINEDNHVQAKSVGWSSSRLTIRLLNLKGPQLNRVEEVLTGHCNLQRHKKTTGRAESSLCPKCSLEDETPNHHVGNCKLYQDIRVKYFGFTKTTVHNVVTKCNINKLATY